MSFNMRMMFFFLYMFLWVPSFMVISELDGLLQTITVITAIAGLFCLWMTTGSSYYHGTTRKVMDQIFEESNGISKDDAYAKIRETYTDAKFFNTSTEMLKHFNLKG